MRDGHRCRPRLYDRVICHFTPLPLRTIRDIIESAALLYEYKAYFPDFGLKSFKEQLEIEYPPKEYRHAFEIAEKRIGETAFRNFLTIASLSLCFEEPCEAFFTILDVVKELGLAYESERDLKRILATSAEVSRHHRGLGTVAQVAFENNESGLHQNPIYREATYHLNKKAGEINPFAVLALPDMFNCADEDLVRPFALKDQRVWVPADGNELHPRFLRPKLKRRCYTALWR
jgi:hypothetical protein